MATLFAGTCSGGALFIAVSDGGDPTGTWQKHYLPFPGRWPDFPTLGYSSSLVAVGANEFGDQLRDRRVVRRRAPTWAPASTSWTGPTSSTEGMPRRSLSTVPDAPRSRTCLPPASARGDAVHAVVALDDGTSSTANLGYASVSGTVAGDDSSSPRR